MATEADAFNPIQRLRIQHRLLTKDRNRINRINSNNFCELHRLMLKLAFKQAKKL